MIHVELPVKTVSIANRREHWGIRSRRTKAHRQAAQWALAGKPKPQLPCTVTLTRIAPRELDGDNLQAALKACRDGVADWLGVDDRSPYVEWRYAQRRGAPRQHSVLVEVTQIGGST